MKCPGQDRGYWSGDRVFDLPCPKCGATVEFFRDEGTRRCSGCGYAFPNARIALDCASWCEQAEACLGISRSGGKVRADTETALAGRLIKSLEEELDAESDLFVRSLLVFQHAKELVPLVGVASRVVLPAALLMATIENASRDGVESTGPPAPAALEPVVERVLARGGVGNDAILEVCGLLQAYRQGLRDTPELAVLHDAHRLASLAAQRASARVPGQSHGDFLTEAGAARAKGLFQ